MTTPSAQCFPAAADCQRMQNQPVEQLFEHQSPVRSESWSSPENLRSMLSGGVSHSGPLTGGLHVPDDLWKGPIGTTEADLIRRPECSLEGRVSGDVQVRVHPLRAPDLRWMACRTACAQWRRRERGARR